MSSEIISSSRLCFPLCLLLAQTSSLLMIVKWPLSFYFIQFPNFNGKELAKHCSKISALFSDRLVWVWSLKPSLEPRRSCTFIGKTSSIPQFQERVLSETPKKILLIKNKNPGDIIRSRNRFWAGLNNRWP